MGPRVWVLSSVVAVVIAAMPAAAGPRHRSDPMRENQWGLSEVNATKAWPRSRGRGVVVAVVDTGIDLRHPDLKAKLVRGANFVRPGEAPQDDHGHGTHVAGVIAAATDNGIGISGVAPDAKLMPVKVLDKNGSGSSAAIAAGIRFAADNGARVINLSLGQHPILGAVATLTGGNEPLLAAVRHAYEKGVVIVAAAGNTTVPICSEPAAAPNVICVGAVGPDEMRAYYSQGDATMTKWFVCGPGGSGFGGDSDASNILSTVGRGTPLDTRDSGYVAIAGTSMAAPHVAGVAALVAAKRRGAEQIAKIVVESARDLGPPGRDSVYGYGVVDAAGAVNR